MTITEQTHPAGLRMDWIPSYQREFDLVLNHPKRYMPNAWLEGIDLQKIVGPKDPIAGDHPVNHVYQPGLVQGLQNGDRIELANGAYGYGHVWNNARTYNFNDPEENQAAALYYANKHPSLLVAQLMEDSNIHVGPASPEEQFQRMLKVERILKRVSDYLVADGIPVEKNWIIQDYFSGNYGWDTWVLMKNVGYSLALLGMNSVEEARKVIMSEGGANRQTGYYYSGIGANPPAYTYRHRMAPGYPEGFGTNGNGQGPYEKIYGLERQYIQMADRKVAMYGHGIFEGLNYGVIEKGGIWLRFPYRSPAGDVIRNSTIPGGWNMMRTQTMIALCIADAYPIWGAGQRVGTDDTKFDYAYMGGPAVWKNRWDNGTGNIVQFSSGAPGQPTVAGPGEGVFNGEADIAENAMWAAHYVYSQIWDRQSGSLRYPSFSFKVNEGSTQNGYYNGNTPVSGVLGTEISRLGVQNVGQNNIAHSFFNGQLPIVFEGRTQGNNNRRVYHVLNIKAGLTAKTTYLLPDGITIEHVGDSWGVYKVDL